MTTRQRHRPRQNQAFAYLAAIVLIATWATWMVIR